MFLSQMTGELGKRYGEKEAIRIIAEAGFDAYDYSIHAHKDISPIYGDNYKEYVNELVEVSKKYNISCNQTHAFFPSAKYDDEEFNKMAFFKITRGIEISGMLGAKVVVVHPVKDLPDDVDMLQYNIDFYNKLLPYCKKFNVKIALENLCSRDKKRGGFKASACGFGADFKKYLEQLDEEWFVGCLDLGHCGLVGDEAQYAIKKLGSKYIHALHVHDNDYRDDRHTMPFLGKIEWEKVCKALAEIGYDNEITYEADNFLKGFPNELVFQAVKLMHDVGRYLIKKIESYKM